MDLPGEQNSLAETWEGPHVSVANPDFDLESALRATILRQRLDEANGGLDDHTFPRELFSDSPLTTPESSPLSSPQLPPAEVPAAELDDLSLGDVGSCTNPGSPPPSSPQLSPAVAPPTDLDNISGAHAGPSSNNGKTKPEDRKKRRKASSHAARQKRRDAATAATYGCYKVRAAVKAKYVDAAEPMMVDVDLETLPVTSTGFTGLDDGARPRKIHQLEDVVGPKSKYDFKLIRWNGRDAIPICDRTRRLVTLLAGRPPDEDWPSVHRQAAQALEERRRRVKIAKGKRKHRRGAFTALATGVSHGFGQKKPGNLANPLGENRKILEELNSMQCFKRIAGFASACMAAWVPKLYACYSRELGKLHKNNPHLKRPFSNSVFSATTYNFGPRTVTFKHVDFANLPFGWCPVTSMGPYDPTKGGHFILWDLHLVIEFPPGSTILIPSAVVAHSNVAISPEERRYSFAQYSAGALFRWVENRNQKATDHYASLSPEQLAEAEAVNVGRWALGLSLFPTLK